MLLFNSPKPLPRGRGKIRFPAQFRHDGSSIGFLVAVVEQNGTHLIKVDGLRDSRPIGSNAHVEMPDKQWVFHLSPPVLQLPCSILLQDSLGTWMNISSRERRPQNGTPMPQGCRCGTAVVFHEFVNNHRIDAITQSGRCPTGSLARERIGVEDTGIHVDATFGHCGVPNRSAVPPAQEMLQAECRPSFRITDDSDLAWTHSKFFHPPAHIAFEDYVGSPFGVEFGEVTLKVLSPVVGRHSLSTA